MPTTNTATQAEPKIRLVLEVTRGRDDSFSMCLQDQALDGAERFVDGISEGQIFDSAEIVTECGSVLTKYLGEVIERVEKPMEFTRAER